MFSYMTVLCGQTLLHRGIIAVSLDKFCSYWSIHKNHKIFYLQHSSMEIKTFKNLRIININVLSSAH